MSPSSTPLVPQDLYRLVLPTDPRIASGGDIFYVRTTMDEPGDVARSSIWRVRRGSDPVAFTTGPLDRMPRPSPDGTQLLFVGDRGEGKRIYLFSAMNGEARTLMPADGGVRALTRAYDAIGSLMWSPGGRRVAFTATAPYDPCVARIAHDQRSGARHIRGLPFKTDEDGLLDGRRKHLFVLDLAAGSEHAVQITHGDFDVEAPTWSPDGELIAFSARVGGVEHSFISDIHVVRIADGAMTQLTVSNGVKTQPAFSHDGETIAFIGHEHGDIGGDRYNTELFVMSRDGGGVRSLSADLDRTVGDALVGDTRASFGAQTPMWSADDVEVFMLLTSEGASSVTAFARGGGRSRTVVGGARDIFGFSLSPRDEIAFVYGDPITPGEVGLWAADGTEHLLTCENPWLRERVIVAPRRLHPRAVDGTPLDLFLLAPPHAEQAPLVVQVHGGPHVAYGYTFSFEFQMLVGHGIGVAYGNPRGSQSYGRHFANGTHGDWGGKDASDVLVFLDAALAAGSWDPERIGLAGGSYGGFMTTHLLARSRRFAVGVSMRAVNDFVSEVGASDCGWFLEDELALEWNGGRDLFERSPMREAHRIEAPLLILHSERDYRCPIDQGEQLFTLLRRLGRKNVEFVRFTGDGHGLSRSGKPRNRLLRLRAIAHWLIRHLQPAGIVSGVDEAGWLFQPLATEFLIEEGGTPHNLKPG